MDMGGGALLHPPETLRGHEQHRQHDHDHDHDHNNDDLGPETSVDDGELQRQQLADLDPIAEPRQEAPTPPAASLLPGQSEADNVADSGEDSEDEWNYFRVESVDVQSLVQAKQSVCPETTPLNLKDQSDDSNDMESRLNPDAAEFVPSPTHPKPSFEDTIISQSPTGKVVPLDDVEVPSMAEFQQEISQRPGEVKCDDSLLNNELISPMLRDLHNGGNIKDDKIDKQCEDLEMKLTEQNLAVFTSTNPFEVSEVSSTKAECGDESATSFATSASDILQKNLGSNTSNADSSLTETDFVSSEKSTGKQPQELFGLETPGEFSDFRKGLDTAFVSSFTPIKDIGTISFEVQKEIAPTMEECPERVKLTDDLISHFSHEQPIAESPAEDSEQCAESEKADVLEESFEHSPNFTLEAFELSSPLNPCAPSFDYQRLDDTNSEKSTEMTKSFADTVDQIYPHALDTLSGANVAVPQDSLVVTDNCPLQSADAKSPYLAERVDDINLIKTPEPVSIEAMEVSADANLLKESTKSEPTDDSITSSYQEVQQVSSEVAETFDKSDFTEIHEKSSEFEQQVHVDNFVLQSERELNELSQNLQEEQSKLDKVHKDSSELEQHVTEVYEKFHQREERELSGDSLKEKIGVILEPSTETNESMIKHRERDDLMKVPQDIPTDVVEELDNFSVTAKEVPREFTILEGYCHKEDADFSDKLYEEKVEQEIHTTEQQNLQTVSAEIEYLVSEHPLADKELLQELNEQGLKEPTEIQNEFHPTPADLFESTVVREFSLENLQHEANEVLGNIIPEDVSGQSVESSETKSTEQIKGNYSETVSSVIDAKGSPPPSLPVDVVETVYLDVNCLLSATDVQAEGSDNKTSEESTEQMKENYSETVSSLTDTKSSPPPSLSVEALKSVSNLDVNGLLSAADVHAEEVNKTSEVCSEENKTVDFAEVEVTDKATLSPDMSDIPEQLRVCVFPLPVQQNGMGRTEDFSEHTSSELDVTDKTSWPPELSDIPEQLRVCVYPLPVKQNGTGDVELIPPSLTGNEEGEQTRELVEHNDYDPDLKLENLLGEQRDMMETLLDKVGNKLELSDMKVATDISVNGENFSADIKEKTEHITEEIFERKDIQNQEESLNKSDVINETSELILEEICSETKVPVPMLQEDQQSEIQEVVVEGDIQTPPPTPASQAELIVDGDLLKVKTTASNLLPESNTVVMAVAAAGVAATAVAVSTKKDSSPKRPATATTKDARKVPAIKEPEKLKSTKTSAKPSPGTTKVTAKTSPTSPTKLSVASTPRTSTPKKIPTVTSTAAAAKPAPKVPLSTKPSRPTSTSMKPASAPASQKSQLSVAGKVSSGTTVGKTNLKAASSATAKPPQTTTLRAASAPKPRVSGTTTATGTAAKTTLTNGDAKPVEVKKASTTTARTVPRSHTAPPRTTSTSKTMTGATAGSVTKTGIQARAGGTNRTNITNGIASKPRVTSSTAPSTRTVANHPTATDKQHKETANKHISARRVGTVPSKTAPAKVGVKKSSPATRGAKELPPANGNSPLISTGEGDKKKTDSLL